MCTKDSVGQVSSDSVGRYVDWHSTDTRSILGQYSVDTSSIDRVSTELSVDISVDSIGRYLADTTLISTHDPISLLKIS